ncbi:MAG: hypothetical protein FWF23_03945 [Alphaproteobacteria bacterium]|nr:hypothetical protein [Alphaproteobacteria bacterium]MCL2506019.1 hypothetical protein [Alphaproteobacteria bacterium]
MDDRSTQQLDKILALADSSHDAEALVAVRKARQMLSKDGLRFSDLAKVAAYPACLKNVKSPSAFSFLSGGREYMASQIAHLKQRAEDLAQQLQTQDMQMIFWKRRITELEGDNLKYKEEIEKWKRLAQETADKLWELGNSIEKEEKEAVKVAERPKSKKAS